MIKPSVQLPVFSEEDVKDPARLVSILTTFRQYCEDLASKAASTQSNVRDTNPGNTDIDEFEFVPYYDGTNYRVITKIGGARRYIDTTAIV